MTPQGPPATSALQALAGDGTLTGSWTLDPARSQVRLESRHTWGLLPVRAARRGPARMAMTRDCRAVLDDGLVTAVSWLISRMPSMWTADAPAQCRGLLGGWRGGEGD